MPSSFDVATSTGSYGVAIAPGMLQATLAEEGERVYMVDAFLADRVRAAGIDPIVIDADEGAKSLDRMTELVVAMRERRATRNTVLVAVGGGVVQDAAAFVASVYMRGLDWVYVPTTLLSMTDSCIGGKSSINVGKYKNIVGTIHPPVQVLVDPVVAETLSVEQRAAGLCEAVKICLCRGPHALDAYLALSPAPDMPADALAEVMALSLGAKKWFIEVDEFDKAERLLLNFGHTFGHALEAASGFGVSHGIAVGLGMIAALYLGDAMGRDYARAPHVAAFRAHVAALVGTVDGLADVLARVEVPALMDAFESDKKHARDRYTVIIVTEDGAVERCFAPRESASAALIAQAFGAMLAEWTGRAARTRTVSGAALATADSAR
jgi:3-dehydroquinate synthase